MTGSKEVRKAPARARKAPALSRRSATAAGNSDYIKALEDFEAGVKSFLAKDFARAQDLFTAFPRKYPSQLELGDAARARAAICERQLHPEVPDLRSPKEWCDQGVLLLNEQSYEEALGLFDKALQNGAGDRAHYLRACALSRIGRGDEALTALGQAIALDPANRSRAANDDDFEALRSRPEWSAILSGPGTEST